MSYFRVFLIFMFLIKPFFRVKAQTSNVKDFAYRLPSSELVQYVRQSPIIKRGAEAILYLPKDYVEDGSVDYTSFLQKAIDENKKISMPNFPILVNDTGLHLRDGTELFFQQSSKLILKASKKTNYGVINIDNVRDIVLYAPKIEGDRYIHLGTDGEWGMGINILNSSNVKIINANISNCWGDGIYLGSKSNRSTNSKILIEGGVIDNNRRNGISVISVNGLIVDRVLLSNSNGTLPMAGIDFEPNSNSETLKSISVSNTISYNNGDVGFLIYLGSMLGVKFKEVQIRLTNCTDITSKKSISIPGLRNDYDHSIQKLGGEIVIKNFTSHDADIVFEKSSGNYIYTPPIDIKAFKAKSANKVKDLTELNTWMKHRKMVNDKK